MVVLQSVGCRSVQSADMPGIYDADISWGRSTLQIRSDSTFEQVVRKKDGSVRIITGTWELHKQSSSIMSTNRIYLQPYIAIADAEAMSGKQFKVGSFEVESVGINGIAIRVDEDRGVIYRKR